MNRAGFQTDLAIVIIGVGQRVMHPVFIIPVGIILMGMGTAGLLAVCRRFYGYDCL